MVGSQRLSETCCYLNGYTSVRMSNVALVRSHSRKHGLKVRRRRQLCGRSRYMEDSVVDVIHFNRMSSSEGQVRGMLPSCSRRCLSEMCRERNTCAELIFIISPKVI